VFGDIDAFFGSLFNLNSKDMEVVRDTVDVTMPYTESRERACNPPSSPEGERFVSGLSPYCVHSSKSQMTICR